MKLIRSSAEKTVILHHVFMLTPFIYIPSLSLSLSSNSISWLRATLFRSDQSDLVTSSVSQSSKSQTFPFSDALRCYFNATLLPPIHLWIHPPIRIPAPHYIHPDLYQLMSITLMENTRHLMSSLVRPSARVVYNCRGENTGLLFLSVWDFTFQCQSQMKEPHRKM